MEWKAEYGLILFLAFAGVTYRLTQGKNDSSSKISQRIYAQFYAWVVTCVLCVGLGLMLWKWHIVVVALITCLLSPVMERGIWLWMSSQNSSNNIIQYIDRFRRTWKAMDTNSTNNENKSQEP
ncbi:hypothetical protein GCM10027592_29440 [Spirosoma flavus]